MTQIRLIILILSSTFLATVFNYFSPSGLSWTAVGQHKLAQRAIKAGLDPVDLSTVETLRKRSDVILIDARPIDHFQRGHIPGALSVPWTNAEAINSLTIDKKQKIIVYCANENCDAALILGIGLREQGYENVALFVGGFETWLLAKIASYEQK